MSADNSDPDVDIDADTVDGYFYTSGHSGKPKGVIHTQGDRIFLNMNLLAELGIRRSDINLHPFPLFHSGPLHTSLVPFIQFGVPTVLMRSFDPERMLECIDEYEATVVGGAPAMLDELIRVGGVGEYDLDSVRFWWFSGAPLTETVRDRCIDLFGEEYSEIYGSTEVGPPISVLQPEEAPAHQGSCGTGLPNQTIRIVDPDAGDPDETVPAGEPGEVIVNGESVMQGYLKRPDLTAEVLKDGWFFTGDIAVRDDDYLFHKGRKDDMIITGGENVYPAEIENVLSEHPQISDVAVLGVPDERWGQTPKAFIVSTDGGSLTKADIKKYCKQSALANFKRPRRVAFVDEIPRNPGGGSILTEELLAIDDLGGSGDGR